jgi:hypothetical protein
MKVVNTALMRHPINWLTFWSMAFLAFYVGHLLISYFSGRHPGEIAGSKTEGIAGPGTDVPENSLSAV